MSDVDEAPRTPSLEGSETRQAEQTREIGMLTSALLEAEDALEREQAAHAALRGEIYQYENAARNYAEILHSTSWRVTAPMRWAVNKIRK
ncbi:MAG: hypothetical protein ABJN34_16715 [Litoreibacter sp.]|uniref:hypothetical protein n=1 Tax=Litoreibacter sp. TaxID=1969459 RepID=UPI003297DEC3